MAEIHYKALSSYLNNIKAKEDSGSFAPVYLIYGEEFLYKTVLNELVDAMIPADKRSIFYDAIDGTQNSIYQAIERINTYALLPGTKVVAICDSNIFYAKQDEEKLINKTKEAYYNQDNKTAAGCLLNLMAVLNLRFDDLRPENRARALKTKKDNLSDDAWIDKIIHYCLDNNLSVPLHEDSAGILQRSIEKGFPKGNHLIITADLVDKRRVLFKTIRKKGMIVDCSVPKGSRRADKIAQEETLSERKLAILTRFGKTIDQSAYRAICEMTGFDLRTFDHNLEKLVHYIGERSNITDDDVRAVLKRTKKDPIYELTNAVSERNIQAGVFMVNSLLADNLHPLQILAALINQIRKLLLAKSFCESSHGSKWHADIQYDYFKSHIMTAIQAYDNALLGQIESWNNMDSKSLVAGDQNGTQKVAKRKRKSKTDLVLAINPNNPYPVYLLLQNSEKFTTDELVAALECLGRADMRLKTAGQRPKIILEKAVISICKRDGLY